MSELKVEVVKIDNILEHPNADRLEIATVKGWQVVCQKDKFKAGDLAVYLPVDSILPPLFEAWLFPPNSKVTLTKSRIKTIKLRGAVSQGMLIRVDTINLFKNIGKAKEGTDLTSKLGITKYEPPTREQNAMSGGAKKAGKYQRNPNFSKYTDIQNVKNYNKVFDAEEIVLMNEKIHGTNFRAGWVRRSPKGLLGRLIRLFKGDYQFVYGSHNVQLQDKMNVKCFYDKNVYAEAVQKYNLKEVLGKDEVIYGEIYGSSIQKNYTYGCKDNERKMVVVDVKVNGEYLSYKQYKRFCDLRKLKVPPVLYVGKFDLDALKEAIKGNSKMVPEQKVMEGGVIRPNFAEEKCYMGRKLLKLISDDYLLLKNNSDLH